MEEKNPPVVDGLENKENNEQNLTGEEKPENNVKGADEKNGEDNKVAKEGEENNPEENPTDHDDDDDFIKALLSDDDDDDDDEVQRQKNRDAEAARKRREAEAKAKAEEEAKKKAEEEARVKAEQEAKLKAEEEAKAKDENPQKQLGKQLVDFHEKYPDIDLKQLDNDVAFKKFIDGKILGKKDFTALYEDYLEIKSNISGKAVEEVSRNYNKQKASSGSSKGSSNPDTGSLYSQKELQEIERRLPFMSAKEANAIMSKYTKSVDYHSKK